MAGQELAGVKHYTWVREGRKMDGTGKSIDAIEWKGLDGGRARGKCVRREETRA